MSRKNVYREFIRADYLQSFVINSEFIVSNDMYVHVF